MDTSSEGKIKTAPGFLETTTGSNNKIVHKVIKHKKDETKKETPRCFDILTKVTAQTVPEYVDTSSKSKSKLVHDPIDQLPIDETTDYYIRAWICHLTL